MAYLVLHLGDCETVTDVHKTCQLEAPARHRHEDGEPVTADVVTDMAESLTPPDGGEESR